MAPQHVPVTGGLPRRVDLVQIGPIFHGQRSVNGQALSGRSDATPGSLRTAGEIVFSPSISGTAESSMCVYGWYGGA